MIRILVPLRPTFPRHLRRLFSSSNFRPADHVRIVEVGPRDGLQNETRTIALEKKVELIERLAETGVSNMEAGSFVPAKWVPQVGRCRGHSYCLLEESVILEDAEIPDGFHLPSIPEHLVSSSTGASSYCIQLLGAEPPRI